MLLQYLQGFDLIKFLSKFTTHLFIVLCTDVKQIGSGLLQVAAWLAPKFFWWQCSRNFEPEKNLLSDKTWQKKDGLKNNIVWTSC